MNWFNLNIIILASLHVSTQSANDGILGGLISSVLRANKVKPNKPQSSSGLQLGLPAIIGSETVMSLSNSPVINPTRALVSNVSLILSGTKRSRGKFQPTGDLTCDGDVIPALPQFVAAVQTCNSVKKSGQPFFVKCVMANLGWMGSDGQVDAEKLVAAIGALIPNDLEEGFLQNGMLCGETARKMRETKWKPAIEKTEKMNCLDIVPLISCLTRVYYYICGIIVDDLLWMISPDTFDYLAIDSVCDSYTIFYPDEFRLAVASCTDREHTPGCRRRCEWKKMGFFDSAGLLDDNKVGEFFGEVYPNYKNEMEQGLQYCYQAHSPKIVSPGRDCRKSVPFFRCMQNLYYHICRRYEPVPELQ